jgi:hypothetical protein
VISHPLNLATPDDAGAELAPLQASVPPAVGLELRVKVTVELSVMTTLSEPSSTETTGWFPKAAPDAALLLGSVVKTSLVAVPALSVTGLLVAEVSTPSVAVRE